VYGVTNFNTPSLFDILYPKILITIMSVSIVFARLQVYFVYGPFAGMIGFCLYALVYFQFYPGSLGLLDSNPLPLLVFAYIVGLVPAVITGLMVGYFVKINHEKNFALKYMYFVSAVVGFFVTMIYSLVLSNQKQTLETLLNFHPLSLIAFVLYGVFAAIVCEFLYSKH